MKNTPSILALCALTFLPLTACKEYKFTENTPAEVASGRMVNPGALDCHGLEIADIQDAVHRALHQCEWRAITIIDAWPMHVQYVDLEHNRSVVMALSYESGELYFNYVRSHNMQLSEVNGVSYIDHAYMLWTQELSNHIEAQLSQ